MSVFNILMLFNVALVAAALLRSRPGALMLAANQVGTLRALDNIQLYGRPSSEAFLPSELFSSHNLEVAAWIFGLSSVLLAVSLAIANPPPATLERKFPALPLWCVVLLGLFFAGLTFSSGNLRTQAYANESGSLFGVGLGGLNALMYSLLLYEVARRAYMGLLRPRTAFLVVGLVLFATSYSKGSTGLATGYGMSAAIMLWPVEGRRASRQLILSVALVLAVGLFAYVVRGVRQVFYEKGTDSIAGLLQDSNEHEAEHFQTGEGFEKSGNGTQYACHMLACINLYETGFSREWRSIYDPLIYTFEPSFLLRPLDIVRPQEAAWELADHYSHGGGIYVLGELYWNGGYACVLIVFALLAVLAYFCDTRFRYSPLWLMLCAQFAPGLLMGAGYGFAQVIRGAFNGLIVIGIYRLISSLKARFTLTLQRALPSLSLLRVRAHHGLSEPPSQDR